MAALLIVVFVAFGLRVLTVEPLTTTFPFVFIAVVVVVMVLVGTLAVFGAGAAFLVPSPRPIFDFVTTVALVALLCSEVLERMEACEAVRWGEAVESDATDVLVRVASAGRGGGSIFLVGDPVLGIVVPVPLNVACSFSRLIGRVSLAPAAPAAA